MSPVHDFDSIEPVEFEHPEPRRDILERLEGEQIARFHHHPDMDPNPLGGQTVGLETTSGMRVLLMFVPDLAEGCQTPWRIRPTLVEDHNMIWTPRVTRHFTYDRSADGETPDDLEKRVEGQVFVYAKLLPWVTAWAGEALEMKFKSGDRLMIAAMPARGRYSCHYGLVFYQGKRIISV